jgi:hypothetical protein
MQKSLIPARVLIPGRPSCSSVTIPTMLAPQSTVHLIFRNCLFHYRIAIVHSWTCNLLESATEKFRYDNWKFQSSLWTITVYFVHIYVRFFSIIWEITCFSGVLIKRLPYIQKGRPNVLLWTDWDCWFWMFPSARRNVLSQVMGIYINHILILWPAIFRKNKYVRS